MVSIYELIEKARKTGKVEKGTNEVTKAVERGTAKLVAYGADVDPKEITQHIPILCKEKNIPCVEVDKKEKLGVAVGLNVGCASVVVIDAGDASSDLEGFISTLGKETKKEE
ncbi:50S ribosomal protein L7ae [Candidatus Pacearchaeota archaeon]|jgi:large subunit ribosomal protein L7Ae|nr:50S ribosomal protein L7ae [Candidatus Pacearchaeota archaeon]|tara:strand:+ start:384 stop:719 length:336 start_codon:yes stop_codon:yes gene_type:complete